jgi:membrane dipeptidase
MLKTPVAALAAFLTLCGGVTATFAATPAGPERTAAAVPASGPQDAEALASRHIVVDTHIDLPLKLYLEPSELAREEKSGEFDYGRAREGHLDVAFMSIYTSAAQAIRGESFAAANELIDLVEALAAEFPERYAIARTVADVRGNFGTGRISLPLGMENGSPLAGEVDNVGKFYERGIRYITLAHSKANALSDSSYDSDRPWAGLSDFGVAVVKEMNRLGMMVDVSHLSDDAFYDVLEASSAPVIASHSSARHFTPGFERNMSDEMIRALAANGGVIMINFGSMFLTAAANDYSAARSDTREEFMLARPDGDADALASEFDELYAQLHGPFPFADLNDVLDHIDHVTSLVGVDYVGLGSDFDGVGDALPIGLKDVSDFPNLVAGLIRRGYSEEDIAKILGENLLRVWAQVETVAGRTD